MKNLIFPVLLLTLAVSVKAYRLAGYESRLLGAGDFNNDAKDAGDVGAGHSVTALYEIVPTDQLFEFAGKNIDSLKYQSTAFTPAAAGKTHVGSDKNGYRAKCLQLMEKARLLAENRN